MAKPNTESKVRQLRDSVASQVRMARADKQLSQIEVASIAGVSPARISELEAGKADPRLSTLARVADALELTITVAA